MKIECKITSPFKGRDGNIYKKIGSTYLAEREEAEKLAKSGCVVFISNVSESQPVCKPKMDSFIVKEEKFGEEKLISDSFEKEELPENQSFFKRKRGRPRKNGN